MNAPIIDFVLAIIHVVDDVVEEEWLAEHEADTAEVATHEVNQIPFVAGEDCSDERVLRDSGCNFVLPGCSKPFDLEGDLVFGVDMTVVFKFEDAMFHTELDKRVQPCKKYAVDPPSFLDRTFTFKEGWIRRSIILTVGTRIRVFVDTGRQTLGLPHPILFIVIRIIQYLLLMVVRKPGVKRNLLRFGGDVPANRGLSTADRAKITLLCGAVVDLDLGALTPHILLNIAVSLWQGCHRIGILVRTWSVHGALVNATVKPIFFIVAHR